MSYFTFLLENMLWSFLPWILFFLVGLIIAFKDLIGSRFKLTKDQEWISVGGFVLTYCILARSQAQLPHYIFVVFPLAAIITAVFLHQLFFVPSNKVLRLSLHWLHVLVFAVLWVAIAFLMRMPFKDRVSENVVLLAQLGGALYFVMLVKRGKKSQMPLIITLALYTVIGVNLFLASNFYPHLLKYQMGNTAADYINRSGIDKQKIVLWGVGDSRALHFYGQHIFRHKDQLQQISPDEVLITSSDSVGVVQSKFPGMKLLYRGPNYPVTILTAEFLDPIKREQILAHYVIIDLKGNLNIRSN